MAAVAANRDRDKPAYRSRRSRPPRRAPAPRRCRASVRAPRDTTERSARYRLALSWVRFTQIRYRCDLSRVGRQREMRGQNKDSALASDRPALRRKTRPVRLEHDPEKWQPVFRKDHAQITS